MKNGFEIDSKFFNFKMANKAMFFEAYTSGGCRIVGYILKFSNRRDILRFLKKYYSRAWKIILSDKAPKGYEDPQEWVEELQEPYSWKKGWMDGRASIYEKYEEGHITYNNSWIWDYDGSSGRQPLIQRYWD